MTNERWVSTFLRLMAYLRDKKNWRVPFILSGQHLIPVGIGGIKQPHNDNNPHRFTATAHCEACGTGTSDDQRVL